MICLALASPARADAPDPADPLPQHLQGDVGGAIYASRLPIKDQSTSWLPLPYLYCDYGRLFARIDTFGVKTVPVGYGYLEVVGRIRLDGYSTGGKAALRGIESRSDSIPLGIGTFQRTPIGGIFINAFHDLNHSNGNLFEIVYAAAIELGRVTLYPQAGLEYNSADYNNYYYSVSRAEAAASGYSAYTPGASIIPSLTLMTEVHLQGNWYTSLFLRRRWLDGAVTNSPLVNRKFQDNGFWMVSYRFE
jgi:outer membrane protein